MITLSDKFRELPDSCIDFYLGTDVKEFIKKLKENMISIWMGLDNSFMVEEIDKLAGDKLI